MKDMKLAMRNYKYKAMLIASGHLLSRFEWMYSRFTLQANSRASNVSSFIEDMEGVYSKDEIQYFLNAVKYFDDTNDVSIIEQVNEYVFKREIELLEFGKKFIDNNYKDDDCSFEFKWVIGCACVFFIVIGLIVPMVITSISGSPEVNLGAYSNSDAPTTYRVPGHAHRHHQK